MRTRLLFPLLLAAAAILLLASPLLLAEPDESDPIPSASVTKEKLEAKVAETEAASGLVEEAKKELLGLYREALVNLEAAAADTQAAKEYSSVVDTAPARIEVLREPVADLQTRHPGPVVSFEGFGDNSLTLLLRAYIDKLDHRLATITTLHKAINKKFRQAGISIAFPQRDLHLNTLSPLQVEVVGAGQAPSGEVK